MNLGKTTISSSVLIPLLSFAAEKGLSRSQISYKSGIDSESLEDANSRIVLSHADRLIEEVLDWTQEANLGLKIGFRLASRSHNLLQHLMLAAPSLLDSIQYHQKFSVLFSDEPIPNLISGELAGVRFYVEKTDYLAGSHVREVIVMQAYRFWMAIKCGRQFRPRYVNLTIPHPGVHAKAFEKAFDCPVNFDCSDTSIWFDTRWLSHGTHFVNTHLVELLEKECLALKLMLESQGKRIAVRIQEALRDNRLNYRIGIEQAADYIGVSARTLNRYLSREGTNFKTLLNNERITLAQALLSEGHLSLEEIAQQVGYSSRRSFDRAFSVAVGYSPAQVRQKLVSGA